MQLSYRLKTIAGMIKKGNRLADIGTDHGYVPIYLVKNSIIPSAIAMDINSSPLEKAKKHIMEEGLENYITTRKSDGLEKLECGEADSILIAGMGGILMTDILKRGLSIIKDADELILSPHSDHSLVRQFLCDNKFDIIDEKILVDDNIYYFVIKAVYNEQMHVSFTQTELMYGKILLENCDQILEDYLLKEEKKKEKIIAGVPPKSSSELREALNTIKEGLKYYGRSKG